ncbi:hypothetical protein H6503_01725 [Candidatus Woesearchaeota archaeon]|nr:hypothetical protein [Candidatus Woesearchaeota archaeon]
MMETISVLLVFLILLTFVVIFYVNISTSSAQSGREDITNLKAVEISQLIAYMPEFQCSSKNIVDENCFDMLKLEAFGNFSITTEGQDAIATSYFDIFEYSRIEVNEIYPDSTKSWLVYERKPESSRVSLKRTFIPISLYNAYDNSFAYGILNITVYS